MMNRWWADDEQMMNIWWADDEQMMSGWWAELCWATNLLDCLGYAKCVNNLNHLGTFKATCRIGWMDGLDGLDLSQTTTTPRAPLYRAVLKTSLARALHKTLMQPNCLLVLIPRGPSELCSPVCVENIYKVAKSKFPKRTLFQLSLNYWIGWTAGWN